MILRLARAAAWRLGRSLAASGLRWPDYAVLHHLEAQGPAAQRELAAALRIQPSNIVALLDELQRRGFLRRTPDPADRRRHRVELTPRGRRVVRRVTAYRREEIARVVEKMPPDERAGLVRALTAFTAAGGEPPVGVDIDEQIV